MQAATDWLKWKSIREAYVQQWTKADYDDDVKMKTLKYLAILF